jgi:hypothetical protein
MCVRAAILVAVHSEFAIVPQSRSVPGLVLKALLFRGREPSAVPALLSFTPLSSIAWSSA